jgi:hypothetical protein
MTSRRNARGQKARAQLTEESMDRAMRRVLPRLNHSPPTNCKELIAEARDFGISTNGQFRALLLRHRRALIAADREPLTPQLEKMYRAEWGEKLVSERLRHQFWWSWEALTRLAFGFEFGERYEKYQRERYPV